VSYLFLPIAQVLATPNTGSMVDVSGVVSSVQETMLMIVKTGAMSGQERPKRSFTLWDNSGDEGGTHMEITLWGDKAHMDLQVGGVLFVKGARTGEWQNRVTLNTAGTTGVEVNPDHPRTFELTRQWQSAGSPSGAFIFASTHSATGAGGSAGGIGYKPGGAGMVVQTVEQCLEEDVNLVSPLAQGQGFNPNMGRDMHRHVVLCTLTGVQTERPPFYAACPETVERTVSHRPLKGHRFPDAHATRRLWKKVVFGDVLLAIPLRNHYIDTFVAFSSPITQVTWMLQYLMKAVSSCLAQMRTLLQVYGMGEVRKQRKSMFNRWHVGRRVRCGCERKKRISIRKIE